MSENEAKELIRKYYNQTLIDSDIIKLFMEYCTVEHNKSPENTISFINAANAIFQLNYYIGYIIKYYEYKFNIIKLLDKELKVILIL